jgi:hypothetical protein
MLRWFYVLAHLLAEAGAARRDPPGYESDWCENRNSRSHPDLRVSRFPAETKLNLHVAHVVHPVHETMDVSVTFGGAVYHGRCSAQATAGDPSDVSRPPGERSSRVRTRADLGMWQVSLGRGSTA